MAITTVGGLKTSTGGTPSVTLDSSPAVESGDLIVWAAGAAGYIAPGPDANAGRFYTIDSRYNTALPATSAAAICVKVAVGGEEGDTLTADVSFGTFSNAFVAVRVFRPSTGWVLDPAVDWNFRKKTGGTATGYTLTAGAATTEADTLGVSVTHLTGTSTTTNWDAAGAGTPDYRSATGSFDYKIYSATGTPKVAIASAGSSNKNFVACWIQERPRNAGQFLPFFGA